MSLVDRVSLFVFVLIMVELYSANGQSFGQAFYPLPPMPAPQDMPPMTYAALPPQPVMAPIVVPPGAYPHIPSISGQEPVIIAIPPLVAAMINNNSYTNHFNGKYSNFSFPYCPACIAPPIMPRTSPQFPFSIVPELPPIPLPKPPVKPVPIPVRIPIQQQPSSPYMQNNMFGGQMLSGLSSNMYGRQMNRLPWYRRIKRAPEYDINYFMKVQ